MNVEPFLKFCEQAAPAAYGQNLQDLFCLWASGLRRDGYFVEFGALNGQNVSNSYLLEKLGWSGIVAEPHPDYGNLIKSNRSCNVSTDCVWRASGEKLTFKAVKGRPALSTVSGLDYDDQREQEGMRDDFIEHQVETISLNDLLKSFDAPSYIDCLSIDTEGSELEILRAFDFSAHTFGTIVAEHSYSSHRDPICKLLNDHGYIRVWTDISDHDDWFVHASYADHILESQTNASQLLIETANMEDTHHAADRMIRLSRMADKHGLKEMAVRCSQYAAMSEPENFNAQLNHAQLCAVSKRTRDAIVAYRKAIELRPNFIQAQNQLAQIVQKQ